MKINKHTHYRFDDYIYIEEVQNINNLFFQSKGIATIFDKITDVIATVNDKGVIAYISPNVEKWFGWSCEELIGKICFSYIQTDECAGIESGLKELIKMPNEIRTFECKFRCSNEEYKDVEMSWINLLDDKSVEGGLLNFHDISDRIKLEKEKVETDLIIRNLQKLESIGMLASGVAHEINNPINGILNYGQIILEAEPNNAVINEYAQEIIHETNRVSEIVKNLLNFSRKSDQNHTYVNIEDIILQTRSLIKTIIEHDQIEFAVEIAEDTPRIQCRSQQIQQVIMNLLTNAHDALNEKYSGYNENKIMQLRYSQININDREWLEIIVEDHGSGIPDDISEKIFDPFFTTKVKGKGTGLGLSISNDIVKEHNGEMKIETEAGQYTRFILHLPCDNGWCITNT